MIKQKEFFVFLCSELEPLRLVNSSEILVFIGRGWPADEKNNWSTNWYEGAYEDIFSSVDFRSANAFEEFSLVCP